MRLALLGELTLRSDRRRGACVLIAIKRRIQCKSRLAEVLEPEARLQLVRSMLAAVLSAARRATTVRQIIVVSPERDCVPAEIPVFADNGDCLNSALTRAHQLLREFDCREVVILPADLPTVNGAEIDQLVRAGRRAGFAIAPDAAGTGTNALCLQSDRPFRFQFGANSQQLHLQEARRTGSGVQVIHLPGLEFDVDSAPDLNRLGGRPWLARQA
jgi:2-phospho-L-lactate guanylyltransferase